MKTKVAGIIIYSKVLGVNYLTLLLPGHQHRHVLLASKFHLNDVPEHDLGEISMFVHHRKNVTVRFDGDSEVYFYG